MDEHDLTGQNLSHYRIVRKLGSGGMGEVYLAQDTTLERTVALKVLPSEFSEDPKRVRRFVREAKSASSIDHPNIVHVFEIGEDSGTHFIAMQYVEGENLRERINDHPIPTEHLLKMAIQITDALGEAHSRKVIHRDLKPANIMVSSKDGIKLLDFGLARQEQLVDVDDVSGATTRTKSEPGVVMGTVAYMSPEQSMGRPVDFRTDIFSLGGVLYEMATGRPPFPGSTPAAVIDKILHSQPESILRLNYAAPQELERIIRKCMEKEVDRRYQSASEVLIDLRNLKRDLDSSEAPQGSSVSSRPPALTSLPSKSLNRLLILIALALIAGIAAYAFWGRSASTGEAIHSLAVLPFENVHLDPGLEYLSDGITDSIINDLSRLSKLRVMARSTVFGYRNKNVDPRQIGKELGVDGVVSGNLVQQGNTLLITVNLVDARDGRQIWGNGYPGTSTSDILNLQSKMSKEISENLRIQLTGNEQKLIAKRYTEDAEAYQLYLQGQYLLFKRTPEGTKKAVEFYQQAIQKDPAFAPAYNGIASCYNFLGITGALLGGLPPRDVMPKAKEYALKSLQLDDSFSDAHLTLGNVHFNYDWDWKEGEKEIQKAIELNPSNSSAYGLYALSLALLGRKEEALAALDRQKGLDPGPSPASVFPQGLAHFWMRDNDGAIQLMQRVIEIEPGFPAANCWIGFIYLEKKEYEKAMKSFHSAVDLSHRAPVALVGLGMGYASQGNTAESEKILSELLEKSKTSYVPAFYVACLYSSQGRKDEAFRWLDKAYEEHSNGMALIKVLPLVDVLRSDPRFTKLLTKMNLSQ